MQPKEVRLGVGIKTHHEGKVQCNSPDSVGYREHQLDRKAGQFEEFSYYFIISILFICRKHSGIFLSQTSSLCCWLPHNATVLMAWVSWKLW